MKSVRWFLPLLASLAFGQQGRVVESIIPALAYGPACSSVVELRNLSDRAATVEVEGHRPSGGLVGLVERPGTTVRLGPHERETYKLDIVEETVGAWVKVRERVPSARLSPAVAVTASTECVVGNELRTVLRDVAFPTRNPWFSSDVAGLRDGLISFINTSERAALVSACYSSGGLYSRPDANGSAELKPICSTAFEVQVPPFGSREFPVSRGGSSRFTLKTTGEAIVLELLRPLQVNVRVYEVDSSIRFGEEVKQ